MARRPAADNVAKVSDAPVKSSPYQASRSMSVRPASMGLGPEKIERGLQGRGLRSGIGQRLTI